MSFKVLIRTEEGITAGELRLILNKLSKKQYGYQIRCMPMAFEKTVYRPKTVTIDTEEGFVTLDEI